MYPSRRETAPQQALRIEPLFNSLRNKQTDRIASTGDRRSDSPERLPTTGRTLYG